jgi:hypothetical protein
MDGAADQTVAEGGGLPDGVAPAEGGSADAPEQGPGDAADANTGDDAGGCVPDMSACGPPTADQCGFVDAGCGVPTPCGPHDGGCPGPHDGCGAVTSGICVLCVRNAAVDSYCVGWYGAGYAIAYACTSSQMNATFAAPGCKKGNGWECCPN